MACNNQLCWYANTTCYANARKCFSLSFYFTVCMEIEGLATKQYEIRRLHCVEIEGFAIFVWNLPVWNKKGPWVWKSKGYPSYYVHSSRMLSGYKYCLARDSFAFAVGKSTARYPMPPHWTDKGKVQRYEEKRKHQASLSWEIKRATC